MNGRQPFWTAIDNVFLPPSTVPNVFPTAAKRGEQADDEKWLVSRGHTFQGFKSASPGHTTGKEPDQKLRERRNQQAMDLIYLKGTPIKSSVSTVPQQQVTGLLSLLLLILTWLLRPATPSPKCRTGKN